MRTSGEILIFAIVFLHRVANHNETVEGVTLWRTIFWRKELDNISDIRNLQERRRMQFKRSN